MRMNNRYFPLGFFILFMSSSLPFSFGYLGPIPDFLWIELIGPMAFVYGLFHLLKESQHPFPYGSRISIIAIFTLALWAFIHYVYNPVFSANLTGANENNVGIRAYYTIFVGICVFFYSLWFSCYWVKGEDAWEKILKITLSISLIVGFARLITYSFGFELPLLKGVFDYDGGFESFTGQTHRIGGLSNAATLGISALLAIYYGKKWSVKFFLLSTLFIFLLFMSGGRSVAFGVLAAMFVHCTLIEGRKSGWVLLHGLIIAGFVLIALQYGFLEHQLDRIASIEGGFAKQSVARYEAFQYMWKIFLERPIFGKGIGYIRLGSDPFITGQLLAGGHGSYLSILMVFGLGGAFFLAVILFGTMFRAFINIRKNDRLHNFIQDQIKMMIYILILLTILSFEFIAGGNGYNNQRLYLLAGILSGLVSRGRYGY